MPYTDEQIREVMDDFFDTMNHVQYVGARYAPIFGRKDEESIEWDNTKPYEPLTIVTYQGSSYTSRQEVPTGIDITNAIYWAETGNYNSQIEAYRVEVERYRQKVEEFEDDIDDIKEDITSIQSDITSINGDILELQTADESLEDKIDNEISNRTSADNDLQNEIDDIVDFIPLNFSTLARMFDYIVEEGTQTKYGVITVNEVETELLTPIIWKYRKWESGIAECWGKRLDDFDVVYEHGSMYTNVGECRENFPDNLFAIAPEYCNITWSGDFGLLYFGASLSSTHTQWYNLLRPTPVLINGYVQVYAIGRWK